MEQSSKLLKVSTSLITSQLWYVLYMFITSQQSLNKSLDKELTKCSQRSP